MATALLILLPSLLSLSIPASTRAQDAVNERWMAAIPAPIYAQPVVDGGKVFVGDWSGTLHAFNAATGKHLWSEPTMGDHIAAAPVVANGTVFVNAIVDDGDDLLVAFDIQNGDAAWPNSQEIAAHLVGSPTVVAGGVFCADNNGTLHKYRTANGSFHWRKQSIGQFPKAANGAVFIATRGEMVQAVDPNSNVVWGPVAIVGQISAAPTVAGNALYVASTKNDDAGLLTARNTVTGAQLWEQVLLSAPPAGSPVVAGENVYVATRDGRITAFSKATGGQPRWSTAVGPMAWSSPVASGNTIYIGDANGVVHALDGSSGDQKWSFNLGGGAITLAAMDSSVYVARSDGMIFALGPGPANTTTFRGDVARTGVMPGPGPGPRDENVAGRDLLPEIGNVQSSPAVVGGVAYVGDTGGILYAVDAVTGAKRWSTQIDGPNTAITSSPAVAAGNVYVVTRKGTLFAFDALTGEKNWLFETTGPSSSEPVRSSPAVFAGMVFFGSSDKHLYAIDAVTGKMRWRFETDGWVKSSPAVAGGVVYFGNNRGTLYAVDAASGKERWRIVSAINPLQQSGTPTVAEGVVYYVGGQTVFAVDASSGSPLVGARGALFTAGAPIDDGLLAVSNGRVFVCDINGRLYAGNSLLAGVAQFIDLPTETKSSPVVVGSTIYVAHRIGKISAVDVAPNGLKLIATYSGGSQGGTSSVIVPVVINDRLYIGGEDGLFVFESGEE